MGGKVKKIGVYHNFPFEKIEDLFKWCKENGVEYIEIRRAQAEDKIKEIEEGIIKYGIKISQVGAENDFIQKTREEFLNQVEIVKKTAEIAKEIGCNQLRIDGGVPKEGVEEKEYKKLIIEGLKRVIEYCEREKIYLAFDNHGVITNDYTLQLEIFEKIKSKYLGANLDTMNYRWYGYPVEKLTEIYRLIAPYTIHTHIKDGIGTKENYQRKVLGEGEIPIVEAIKILNENNYKGVWCIEYEGENKEIGYKKCVEFLKKLEV
jgi:sugar phosphate isomerase/epimerase